MALSCSAKVSGTARRESSSAPGISREPPTTGGRGFLRVRGDSQGTEGLGASWRGEGLWWEHGVSLSARCHFIVRKYAESPCLSASVR